MKYVYFTKMLRGLSLKEMAAFSKDAGLDGVDLVVRPGYPVTPANVAKALPEAAKLFADAGLVIGFVSATTDLIDPEAREADLLFEACAKAGVPAVKIGYFAYRGGFDEALKGARAKMAGFAKLAARTKVKACYHTHSGNNLGNNAAGLRMLLYGLDPHHAGAFIDTGHTAVNGGPAGMEVDILRPWLSLVAIKDMLWKKGKGGWTVEVVPVGGGIVRWGEVGKALRAAKFNGTVSIHGEYEAASMEERLKLAKAERQALRTHFGA